jgi:hypothetical protein
LIVLLAFEMEKTERDTKMPNDRIILFDASNVKGYNLTNGMFNNTTVSERISLGYDHKTLFEYLRKQQLSLTLRMKNP